MAEEYGNLSTGFKAKRLADIVDSLKTRLQTVTDPDTGQSLQIDANDGSVISQILGIIAEELSLCWQAAEAAALQFDPLCNTGAGQSGTVQINAIVRRAGYPTRLSMTLTGNGEITIPRGSLVGSQDGKYQFATVEDVTLELLSEVYTGTVDVLCTVNGAIEPENGTVNAILSPVDGWATAVNTETIVVGEDEETDEELRIRQQASTALSSKCQIEAIYDAVSNVEGVTYCRVYQNDTLTEDERGLDGKSVAVVVVGGDDEEIAEVIFNAIPVGVSTYGNLPDNDNKGIEIVDAQGFSYYINFVRPEEVPIYVELEVVPTEDTPAANYVDLIKQAIVDYSTSGAGAVGATINFDRNGFQPGEDIILSQLYTPINSVAGLSITSLEIGIAPESLAADNIEIDWDEVGTFAAENITVNEGE